MWLSMEITPRRRIGWLLAVMLVIPALARAEDPKDKEKTKDDKPATPAEEYQALEKEYQAAEQEFYQKLRELTPGEQGKHFEKFPLYTFTPRFLELAQKHPKDAAAIDPLVWVATRASATDHKTREAWNTAIDTLLSDHIENEKLAQVAMRMAYSDSANGERFLRTAWERSPHREVKGQACFTLAQFLKRKATSARYFRLHEGEIIDEQSERYYGKEYIRVLKESDPDKLMADVEQLCELVMDEYADVKHWRGTLGTAAEGELFEIRNLAIGKVAPDIEGEDIDGEQFKISDYRGKVVVLDFWGNW